MKSTDYFSGYYERHINNWSKQNVCWINVNLITNYNKTITLFRPKLDNGAYLGQMISLDIMRFKNVQIFVVQIRLFISF